MPKKTPESLIDRILKSSPGARRLSDLISENPEDPFGEYRKLRTVVIKDSEWAKLKSLSGLRDDARRDIENDIIHYRNTRDAQISEPNFTPSETKEQLQSLAKLAQGLHECVERALDNDKAALSLTTALPTSWGAQDIWFLSDRLKQFSELSSKAADKCGRARPGPGDPNLNGLIASAALRWADSTRLPLSVSNRRSGPGSEPTWNALDFIIAVVKIAHPDLWRSSGRPLDERIKDIVKGVARKMGTRES